jgi:hypothetical protein
MIKLTPTTITAGMLTSSTAPEPAATETAWVSAGTYALGDLRIRATTHKVYLCIQTHSGRAQLPEDDAAYWTAIGPTNRWACFDRAVGTATTLASPLTIVLAPGMVNALALLELVGTSVTVSMTSASEGGATVYSSTTSLEMSAPADYYNYFFDPFIPRRNVLLTGLPPYEDGVITITLTGSGDVSLGAALVGLYVEIGAAQYGATAGIDDYSVKTTDAYGTTTITERAYAKRATFKLWLSRDAVNVVHRALADGRATPCLYAGTPDQPEYDEAMLIYGWPGSFQLEIAYPTVSLYSLEIKGLT